MVINKKAVAQRIKLIRQTKGMTLEEFGKLFDASKGNVSLWEKGSSLPSNERIKRIAYIGNMSVDELLYGDPNIKRSLDDEQNDNLIKYVDSKRQVIKQELKLFKNSSIEGFLSGIGLAKGLGDKGVEDYKRHQNRLEDLEKIGKKYIESNYNNYTYDKFLQDFPDSNPQGFGEYKEKEWATFKEVLDNFWEAFDITTENYSWINNRFTDQISNELDKIKKIAIEEGKEHYYVNEVVQPFLDQAAKDFKEYIKDYIDTED